MSVLSRGWFEDRCQTAELSHHILQDILLLLGQLKYTFLQRDIMRRCLQQSASERHAGLLNATPARPADYRQTTEAPTKRRRFFYNPLLHGK